MERVGIQYLSKKILLYINFYSFSVFLLKATNRTGSPTSCFYCIYLFNKHSKVKEISFDCFTSFSIFSNFLTIEILKPDIPNHATTADFGIFVEKGYLLKNLDERSYKGKEYTNNINQAKINIKNDWKKVDQTVEVFY